MTLDNHFGPDAQQADSVATATQQRIATLETFYQDTYGHPLPANGKRALDLRLAVEKFNNPGDKHYRIIWTGGKRACLASEDVEHYATRGRALLAAALLSAKSGVAIDGRRR